MTDKDKIRAELEEAAKMYAKKESHGYEPCNIVETFKAGANWQKQQMMKDAIETTIVDDWQYGKDQDHTTIPAIHQRIDGCKVGDKVKVIVIKEDEQ